MRVLCYLSLAVALVLSGSYARAADNNADGKADLTFSKDVPSGSPDTDGWATANLHGRASMNPAEKMKDKDPHPVSAWIIGKGACRLKDETCVFDVRFDLSIAPGGTPEQNDIMARYIVRGPYKTVEGLAWQHKVDGEGTTRYWMRSGEKSWTEDMSEADTDLDYGFVKAFVDSIMSSAADQQKQ